MNRKSSIFGILGLLVIVIGGGAALLLSNTAVQEEQTPDTVAAGCNACDNGKSCSSSQDWEQGYYSGCTNRDSEEKKKQEAKKEGKEYKTSVSRNNKPDVSKDGTVQAGDQGRSGKEAGENVNDPNKKKVAVAGYAHGVYEITYPDGSKATIKESDFANKDAAKAAAENAVKSTNASQANKVIASSAGRNSDLLTKSEYEPLANPNASCGGGYKCFDNSGNAFCIGVSGGTCIDVIREVQGFYIYPGVYSGSINGGGGGSCSLGGTFASSSGPGFVSREYDSNLCDGADTVAQSYSIGSGTLYTCSGLTSPDQFNDTFANGCQGGAGSSIICTEKNVRDAAQGICGVVQCDAVQNGVSRFISAVNTSGCNFAPAAIATAPSNPIQPTFVTTSVPTSTTTSGGSSSGGSSTGSPTTTTTTTSPPVDVQCNYLNQTSPAVANDYAPGQAFSYTAEYTCAGLNNNLALVVLDSGDTAVGSPTIVPQSSQNYDASNNLCTYTFNWTATGVTDGDYDVRLLTNGALGSEVESPIACTEQLSVLSGAEELPAFTVIKTSSHQCTNGGATLSYQITARNIGNVSANLDFVEDTLPDGIDASSTTQVTGINPTPTSRSADVIRWDVNQSLAPGETRVFTYNIVLSEAQAIAFSGSTLNNFVLIQYGDNDSTAQFENSITINCLPDTAIFDENPVLLLGLLLIIAGIVINRSGLVLKLFGIESDGVDASSGVAKKLFGGLVPELDSDSKYEKSVANSIGSSRSKKKKTKRSLSR